MLTASKMELISMVVLKENVEEVTTHLLKLGSFHPVDIRAIEDDLKELSPFQIDKEYAECTELDTKATEIVKKLHVSLKPQKSIQEFSYDEAKSMLSGMEQKFHDLMLKKEELHESVKTKESIYSQIRSYLIFPIKRESAYSFLEVSLGRIDEGNLPALERSLKDMPHILYPFRKEGEKLISLFIGLRRDRVFIQRVLKDLAWENVEYPKEPEYLSKGVEQKLSAEINEMKKRLHEIDSSMKKLGEDVHKDLSAIHSFIRLKKSLLEAKKFSCTTEKTALLSGWVPEEQKEAVIQEIQKIDSCSCLEIKHAEEIDVPKDEIPVKLKHHKFLKPFELLIDTYGIPRYGTIDPTIFTAFSFLLMFGAMFGDIGQGLVLSMLGLFLWKTRNEKVSQAGVLLSYCGLSSAIFGALYGSFFGFEFESVWLKPIHNIIEIFKLSVFFGISLISIGILINIINALRDRDYVKAIFDKSGLIGGLIYWLSIALVTKLFVAQGAVPVWYVFVILGGFALLLSKPFIELIFRKSRENLFVSLIEGIVDILEIIMGYLANTVSFIRIAAFALAHAGLFFAIFELSRILNSKTLSFLIVIFGNIFIILLEGMVVSIQSLRLNYYEFFSKFFMTGKKAYKPLSM